MHRKGHTKKHRATRRKHRGGYYGFQGGLATGAPNWKTGSEMGDFAVNRAGNATYGAGRRRKHHKKTRRTRKHRGGGKFGGVSASYQGSGIAGMAEFDGIITRDGSGAPAGGAFNNHGAQPGSGYGSFVKAH
jgi:hypothetical protein